MKKIFNVFYKVIIIAIVLFAISIITNNSFATTIYTKGLNKGDKLKLVADGWNVYSSLKLAEEANGSKASSTLKKDKHLKY